MMVDLFFKVAVYSPAINRADRCHRRSINSRE